MLSRFVTAGIVGLSVNLGVLSILTHLGIWYQIAAGIAFSLSTITSFVLQKWWAFGDKRLHLIASQLPIFIVIALVNVGVNALVLRVLVEQLNIYIITAQVVSSGLIAIEGFFIYKRLFRIESKATT